jgi:hypothetical protein
VPSGDDSPRKKGKTIVTGTNIQFTAERKQLSLAFHRILPGHAGGAP